MSELIYITNTSLDGCVEDEAGALDWVIKFTRSSLSCRSQSEPISMGDS
jgi:hypothetical protein